jgi:two-component system, NtrC family, sensor kinase
VLTVQRSTAMNTRGFDGVEQRSVETALISTLGETWACDPPCGAGARSDARALLVGTIDDDIDAFERSLSERGVAVQLARSKEEMVAQLAASEFDGLLLSPTLSGGEADELARCARLECGQRALAITRPPTLELAPLELGTLLELLDSRARARQLEVDLAQARRELLDVKADHAALLEQARAAQADLRTAEAQVVQCGKLAALGELVAGIAHEINNPLSFALSHLSTLRVGMARSLAELAQHAPETGASAARLEDRLSALTVGLNRIRTLVEKLQTYTRFDQGDSRLVDVADAVGTVLTIVEHRTRDRVRVRTTFGDPRTIQCDPGLIDQCVMNLVTNAIDAIEGEGSIDISAGREGEQYVIQVVDSGRGIEEGIHGRVFEPFFTTKPPGKGTGLGLSIAQAIVRKHDGTLKLSNAKTGGTQARIDIPLGRVSKSVRSLRGR